MDGQGCESKEYDAIVIGAGLGGLTCGALLARRGLRALVLEQHLIPGGYCTSFKRKGFTFDSAVHFVEGLGKKGRFYQILKELKVEKELKVYKLDPLYRVIYSDRSVLVPTNLDDYIELLSTEFPGKKENISKFFIAVDELNNEVRRLPYPLRAWNLLSIPMRFRLVFKYYKKTFAEMLSNFFHDEKLKAIISAGWPYVGLPPSQASAISVCGYLYSAHFEGFYYPKGGTQALADALAGALAKNGGELQLGTRVKRILIENGRAVGVETSDGKRIGAKFVVSNADARQTFLELVDAKWLDKEFVGRLKRMEPSISFFQTWLGVDIYPRELGVNEVETLLYPSYDIDKIYRTSLRGEIGGCGICVPSLVDPTLAPKGKHCVSLIYPTPYGFKQKWRASGGKRGEQYKKLKHQVKQRLIKTAEKVLPGLSEHVIVSDAATPITCERYTSNYMSAAYGWAQTPSQSSKNRPQQITPIKNLYLAGHWTTPGGGTITAALSGQNAARLFTRPLTQTNRS